MTPIQERNVLDWVEALLSGQYNFGKFKLFDHKSATFCALGVAANIDTSVVRRDGGFYWPNGVYLCLNTFVPEAWFEDRFGLPKDSTYYQAINDKARNYHAVAAQLLKALPRDLKRRKELDKKLLEQVGAQFVSQ